MWRSVASSKCVLKIVRLGVRRSFQVEHLRTRRRPPRVTEGTLYMFASFFNRLGSTLAEEVAGVVCTAVFLASQSPVDLWFVVDMRATSLFILSQRRSGQG